jgi:hypothetical protein
MKLTYPEKLQVVAEHQHSAPIQTVPLAQELGLKVWHVPNWPKELSGKIERSYSWRIFRLCYFCE